MRRGLASTWLAVLLLTQGSSAAAWVVLPASSPGQEVDPAVAHGIAEELAVQGVAVVGADEATARFLERASTEVAPVERGLVAQVDRAVQDLLEHVASQQGRLARRDMARLEQLVAQSRDALEQDQQAARALHAGCLHAARAFLEQNEHARAVEQVRRCISLYPGLEPDIHHHPPSVFGLVGEVRAELSVETLGTLRVESERAGCAVSLNGRPVGITPAEVTGLIPGEYRVRVECAGERADRPRLHRVVVAAQRRILYVDTRLDRAVRTTPVLALVYAGTTEKDERRVADGGTVGEILQDTPVVLATRVGGDRYRLERLDSGAPRVSAVVIVDMSARGRDRLPQAIDALRRHESLAFDVEPPATLALEGGPSAPEPAPAAPRPARAPTAPAPRPPARAQVVSSRAAPEPPGGATLLGYSLGTAGILTVGGGWVAYGAADVDAGPLVAAAVAGGLMLAVAAPLSMPEARGVPWWAWTAGVAGVGLAVWGGVEVATHGECEERFRSGACRIEVRSADAGALLLAAAVPLLEVPFVYALRPEGVPLRASAFLDLRERGAVVAAGGVF